MSLKISKKYSIIRYPVWLIFQILPKGIFVKKSIKNSKKYCDIDTGFVGNFVGQTRFVCSTDVFSSFVDVEFEGEKYPAPIGYDEWLKSFYGDYMKLPPKEKQVSHHKFVAYYKR